MSPFFVFDILVMKNFHQQKDLLRQIHGSSQKQFKFPVKK